MFSSARMLGWAMCGLVVSALLTAAPPAFAQANCAWYAETALKQQQRNEKSKCGFTGTSWSSDLKSHITWCGSVAPDVWKKEAQLREQNLETCAAGK